MKKTIVPILFTALCYSITSNSVGNWDDDFTPLTTSEPPQILPSKSYYERERMRRMKEQFLQLQRHRLKREQQKRQEKIDHQQ